MVKDIPATWHPFYTTQGFVITALAFASSARLMSKKSEANLNNSRANLTVIAITLMSSANYANAQTLNSVDAFGGTFSFGVGAKYVSTEVATGIGIVDNHASFLFIQDVENGAALDDFGFSTRLQLDKPIDIGGVERSFSLGLNYVAAETSNSIVTDGTFIDVLPVDGSLSPGNVGDGTFSYDIKVEQVDIFSTVGTGTIGAFATSLGAMISHRDTALNVSSDSIVPYTLNQNIQTGGIGPVFSAVSSKPLRGGWRLETEFRLGLLYTNGKLESQQSGLGFYSQNDRKSNISGYGDIALSAKYTTEAGADIALFGGFSIRNDSFKAVNPRSGPGIIAIDSTSYQPTPSFLETAVQSSAAIGFDVSFTF